MPCLPAEPAEQKERLTTTDISKTDAPPVSGAVLTEIRRVILEPSLEDPLNDAVAQQFTHSREEYEEGVRDWVVRFAGPPAAGAEQLAAAAEQARDDE